MKINIVKQTVNVPTRRMEPWITVNGQTTDNIVVVDVLNEVANWIVAQPKTQWDYAQPTKPFYFYERFSISPKLFSLMVMRWS